MEFDREELLGKDETLVGNTADMALRRSIVLCCIFEDLMRRFGWKRGDTLPIEEDICDVVGKLMVKVEEPDRFNILDCMQSAMMNIHTQQIDHDGDKLRSLLIRKKKYNGLNLACILFEQLIIENKNSNASWMRIVCTEFIELVVQLIIEPAYRADIYWNLNYLLKLKRHWTISDIYNLTKNGLLMFQYRQDYFHRHLIMIRNFVLVPSSKVLLGENESFVRLKFILYCRDEDNLSSLNREVYEEETEKSFDQVLSEMKEGEIEQAEKDSMRTIIQNSISIMEKYKNDYEGGIVEELKRIHNSEEKDDMASSRLAVTSMALYLCKGFWPLNTQLVSYCLMIVQNRKGRLLEILTGEGKSCVIAMVAATYALQGRTVDIVTSSHVLSQRDAEEWRNFFFNNGTLRSLQRGRNRNGRYQLL